MCRLLLMTIGCLLILFGISGLLMMPKLIQQKLEQRLQLKIDTKTFDRFTKVPIPLTVKFYLFNVTNSEQVLLGLQAPQFEEVGPFMFKQWRRREIADFEDYNRRLKYREIKTYYPMFTKNSSRLSEQSRNAESQMKHNSETSSNDNNGNIKHNDNNNNKHIKQTAQQQQQHSSSSVHMLDPHDTNVTIINLPLLSVLTQLAQLEEGSFKRNLAAKVATRLIQDGRDKILITRPANQLLFDGYKVDFMESARDLISGTLGFNFESPLPKNMFGFFYNKNNTWTRRDNGLLTVWTGRNESMNDFMMIDSFNDQKELNIWFKNTEAGNRCNQIKGTDGSQFHPGVNKLQILSIFSPMVCRSLYIKYKEETSVRDIPLLRFHMPPELFAAPRKSSQNACYCTVPPRQKSTSPASSSSSPLSNQSAGQPLSAPRITDSRCYLDGLMDLSLCQRGAPIAASSPHFYNADPLLAMASGLKPKRELHETYLDIEPMTGSVFRAASRAQINAFVEQAALDVVDSAIIGNMKPMIAPLLWLEEAAEIDEKSANDFKKQLLNLVQKVRRSCIYAIVFGLIVVVVVSIQYWYVTCYSIDIDRPLKKARSKDSTNSSRSRSSHQRARRRQEEGKQLRANMRLGADARKSNLATSMKSADEQLSSVEPKPGSSVVPVMAMAAALGTAGASRRQGRARGAADPKYDEDEEELSKRMLVADEWEPAAATNTSSSGRSSAGADNQAAASNGEQLEDLEPESREEEAADLMKPSTSSGGGSF